MPITQLKPKDFI